MSSILPYTQITLLIPIQLYFNYTFYLKTGPYKHIMSPKSDHQKNACWDRKVIYLMHKLLCFVPEVMVSCLKYLQRKRKQVYKHGVKIFFQI